MIINQAIRQFEQEEEVKQSNDQIEKGKQEDQWEDDIDAETGNNKEIKKNNGSNNYKIKPKITRPIGYNRGHRAGA